MDNPSIPPTQPPTCTTSQWVFSPTHPPSDAQVDFYILFFLTIE